MSLSLSLSLCFCFSSSHKTTFSQINQNTKKHAPRHPRHDTHTHTHSISLKNYSRKNFETMCDRQQLTPTSSPNSGTGTGRRHRTRQLLTALAMSRSNPRWLDFEMPVYRAGEDDRGRSSSSLSFIPVHEGSMSEIVQRALDIVSQAATDRDRDSDPSTTCSSRRFAPAHTGTQHESHHHNQSGNQEGGDMSSEHHGIDSTEQQESGPNDNDQEQS